jgi:transposase
VHDHPRRGPTPGRQLGRRCQAKIEAVAIDMSPASHDAVSTYLPKATIVYDHFHVIKLFNEKLSNPRRWLHQRADDAQKKVLKGSPLNTDS